jgi:hypothetical protein
MHSLAVNTRRLPTLECFSIERRKLSQLQVVVWVISDEVCGEENVSDMTDDVDHKVRVDWRHRVATTLAQDFVSPATGERFPAGTPVIADTFIEHGDLEICIGDPSASALFLNIAYRARQRAISVHPFLVDCDDIKHRQLTTNVYDCLEEIITSIIFSYAALEAFANEEIPAGYVDQVEEKLGSGLWKVRQHNQEAIERHASLTEKLSRILPELKQVTSPKGMHIGEGYVDLRRLRDRVVHLKSSDRQRFNAHNRHPESIWTDLLDPKLRDFPDVAKQLVLYFKKGEHSHWLENCPF